MRHVKLLTALGVGLLIVVGLVLLPTRTTSSADSGISKFCLLVDAPQEYRYACFHSIVASWDNAARCDELGASSRLACRMHIAARRDSSACDRIDRSSGINDTLADFCHLGVALDTGSSEPCAAIQAGDVAERCYRLVAVATGDVALCAPFQHLRPRCYSDVALYNRNVSACLRLPWSDDYDPYTDRTRARCFGLLANNFGPSICDQLDSSADRDQCLVATAWYFGDETFCGPVRSQDLRSTCHEKFVSA